MPKENSTTERPPVVVVLGHVDHGKSSLLDYIRKTNVVGLETGGITQRIGAYELTRKDEEGHDRRITFLDTPGHAAFYAMRERGAAAADIAILVVAADDGVKPQTLEALEAIRKADIPFIVAINKTDKPDANTDKTKQSLAEAGVYVEGYGGTVPVAEISAKTGAGVDNLISLLLLSASLEELKTDSSKNAMGVVIESHRDPRRGVLATLIVLDGKLKPGDYLVTSGQVSTVRTFCDFRGVTIKQAVASSPVQVTGFSQLPQVGESFRSYASKKEAEAVAIDKSQSSNPKVQTKQEKEIIIPIVLKADSTGTLEAIGSELGKRENEQISVKLVSAGVGDINESDIKLLLGSERPVVFGFNVGIDRHAQDLAEKNGVPVQFFDIIYKLTEWFDRYIENVIPKKIVETITGEARVLKTFSQTRDRQVLGGVVKAGEIRKGAKVHISRSDERLGEGKLVNLQKSRVDADTVAEGEQFGAIVESRIAITEGDILQIISLPAGRQVIPNF